MNLTTEPLIKLLPLMVSVNPASPAKAVAGFNVVSAGTGLGGVIVKVTGLEVKPLAAGSKTVMPGVPAALMSAFVIAAVNFVAETKVVGRSAPFHFTFEFAVKPLPKTIREKSPLCACFVVGSSAVITTGGTTVKENVFWLVAPQLSVAVTVTV